MTNLEATQAIYRAFAGRDLPALLSLVHDDLVIAQTPALPWGGEFRGTMGLQQFLVGIMKHIDSRVEIDEYIDAAEGIVAIGWTRGKVLTTGAPFESRIAHVWTFRDGKAALFQPHIDTPAMLKALSG